MEPLTPKNRIPSPERSQSEIWNEFVSLFDLTQIESLFPDVQSLKLHPTMSMLFMLTLSADIRIDPPSVLDSDDANSHPEMLIVGLLLFSGEPA